MASIATSLGIGSGIDTQALIDQLASASKAPKEAAIAKREESHKAQLSTLASVSAGIDTFASSLSTLISGGSLFTQPSASDGALIGVSALAGARLGELSALLEVRELAQAQSLVSADLGGITEAVGKGTLTLTAGGKDYEIVIGADNDSLVGLVRAINSSGAPVEASIVEDAAGARLAIKGGTGAGSAFTLAADGAAEPALARFAYDPNASGGLTRAQEAKDALLRLDGVEVRRAGNSFSDLLPGVKIDLKRAAPGSVITIGSSRPTAAIKAAVEDFAAAFNELRGVLAEATAAGALPGKSGPLRSDPGTREMLRKLSQLTSTPLAGDAKPSTLAEIGVRTARDGTLSVDTVRLEAALKADPAAVEALFNPGQRSSSPLLTITSPMGRAKPGTYQMKDVVPSDGITPPSGIIGGMPALPGGLRLIAAIGSPADGLVIEPTGVVASATITVDLGLGGALQAIRDSVRASSGPLAATSKRLAELTTTIADDRAEMEDGEAAYRARLVTTYAAMEKRVSAFKATQSYLEQQIKVWTNSDR